MTSSDPQTIPPVSTMQQADNLEESITTYFNRGFTIQQICHALTTSHHYTQSLQGLERKQNTIKLSRCTNGVESQKVDVETFVSCMIEILQTPKGCNVSCRKMKKLLNADQVWHHSPQVSIYVS
ncbi:hypothetical protein VP01_827g5 [Puccinia sorghi]|uniref:Uncharacterized protein n=1 Tax=Puccinia sorghi TaxID=27349 RepID=A0A0L6U9S5_9BASI|nr:hypothetical protein VP01_827g5 [Puccinia sorghi]